MENVHESQTARKPSKLDIPMDTLLDEYHAAISAARKKGDAVFEKMNKQIYGGKWHPDKPWIYAQLLYLHEEIQRSVDSNINTLRALARIAHIAHTGHHPSIVVREPKILSS